MSLTLQDQDTVLAAYESVVNRESAWLLLGYPENNPARILSKSDQATLYGTGSGGLPDLKRRIGESTQIFVAFCREDKGYVLINYVPHGISGSRRARVLVQSRRIAALFQVEHGTLTIDNLGNLTPNAVQKAIKDPSTPHLIEMERSASSPSPDGGSGFPEPLRKSFSEIRLSSSSSPASPPKSQSMFSSFLRRNKVPTKSYTVDERSFAPPTPPKETMKGHYHTSLPSTSQLPSFANALPVPEKDISEFAVIESGNFSSDDEEVVVVPNPTPRPTSTLVRPSKWVTESTVIADPAERARRRAVAQRQREMEESLALQEELDRQARMKLRKEEMMRQESREEAERRATVEKEIRRAQALRRQREQMEKEEEERRRVELAARKAEERLKRKQDHMKLERWRYEHEQAVERMKRMEEEKIRHEKAEREKRLKQAEHRAKASLKAGNTFDGWASIQISESIVWRRRFYKLDGNNLLFYRSPKDLDQVLETLPLAGELSALREWNEGYEELEAVPHSFAIEFKDQRGHWAMYTDTEDEKFQLLALFKAKAGL